MAFDSALPSPACLLPRHPFLSPPSPAAWLGTAPCSTQGFLGSLLSLEKWRPKKFVALAISHQDSKNSDIEVDNDNANLNAGGSQEAWKEALECLKAEDLNVKSVSEEVYQVYSMKAIEMLMDASENLKIQADKAQRDLRVMPRKSQKKDKSIYLQHQRTILIQLEKY